MSDLDSITAHIRQLEQVESALCQQRQNALEARRQEDEESLLRRKGEDEAWKKRMQERDEEEDVGS